MKVVKVYGELKERLGGRDVFEFNVFNPAEAIKALLANFEGLDKWFIDSEKDGLAYRVLLGDSVIEEDGLEELFSPWSERDVFHIIPVLTGSNWFKKFMIGATIVGIGMITGGVGLTFAGGIGVTGWAGAGWVAQTAILTGLSLMADGISDALTPDPPKPPAPDQLLESFSFTGIEQTTKQGGAIPIVYGKCFIGSSVLSAGIETYDS